MGLRARRLGDDRRPGVSPRPRPAPAGRGRPCSREGRRVAHRRGRAVPHPRRGALRARRRRERGPAGPIAVPKAPRAPARAAGVHHRVRQARPVAQPAPRGARAAARLRGAGPRCPACRQDCGRGAAGPLRRVWGAHGGAGAAQWAAADLSVDRGARHPGAGAGGGGDRVGAGAGAGQSAAADDCGGCRAPRSRTLWPPCRRKTRTC